MRALIGLIILAIFAIAALASHQHKPFVLRIDGADAKPAAWPTNAGAPIMPGAMMCLPCFIRATRRPALS